MKLKVLLATLHAKYVHSSLALPYLGAACRDIPAVETVIREFTINEHSNNVLDAVTRECADIVAFSCYIWNVEQTLRLASDLKKISPPVRIILGGPEVSFNPEEILGNNKAVDCIIRGEGEGTLRAFLSALSEKGNFDNALRSLPSGTAFRDGNDIFVTPLPEPISDLDSIPSPFAAGIVDLSKPLVYYETSRGCPFSCAFCISSLEKGVRAFSGERIKDDLLYLMNRRAGTIKLVDRTFNYDAERANEIWAFILSNNMESRFHFEIAADLLTEENLTMLEKVPEGMFRFEIGVQSGSGDTLRKIGRKTDLERLFHNVTELATRTSVIIHLDLIAGLPGDDLKMFFRSLQRLFDLRPHHIQVEPLKVLKGSPMEDIAQRGTYAYSQYPPYAILTTPDLSFADIRGIEAVSRLLDTFFNSGRFKTVLSVVEKQERLSDFFARMSYYTEAHRGSPLASLRGNFELLWEFLRTSATQDSEMLDALCYDFCLCEYPSAGNVPEFFKESGKELMAGKLRVEGQATAEKGTRIRSCVCSFHRDYTTDPWKEGKTEIAFTYISAPGRGLQVKAEAHPQA